MLRQRREVLQADVLTVSSECGYGVVAKFKSDVFTKATDQVFRQLQEVCGPGLVGRATSGKQGRVEVVLCRVLGGEGGFANNTYVVDDGPERIGGETVSRSLAVKLVVKETSPGFEC